MISWIHSGVLTAMLGNDRGETTLPKPVGIGLGLIALLLLGVLLWAVWTTFSYWNQSQENAKQIQTSSNRYTVERCYKTNPVEASNCISEASEAAQDKQRDEADLYAQRQMAVWALVMAVTTLVSIPLSLAGIFFVWRSLSEMAMQRQISQQALQATFVNNLIQRQQADTELGPRFDILRCIVQIQSGNVVVDLKVKNVGSNSALSTKFSTRVSTWKRNAETGTVIRIVGKEFDGWPPTEVPRDGIGHLDCRSAFEGTDVQQHLWNRPDLIDISAELVWKSKFGQSHGMKILISPRAFRTAKRGKERIKTANATTEIRSRWHRETKAEDESED